MIRNVTKYCPFLSLITQIHSIPHTDMSLFVPFIVFQCLVLGSLAQALGCYRNGTFYEEGSQFQPTPCEHCYCNSGIIQCRIAQCYITLCVDPVHDPNKCCPDCPNGKLSKFVLSNLDLVSNIKIT